ncbi:Hsp20/alpha crystallin family protein [Solitalea longa]|uniref:Hsp20/alpha crystallin family protein n=1 Tax=Solitalea longa TaxID=2079460 RepID=A0A2S5A187_9SPHI|nr:Hsp20/alpha crystallin family protein [Solitalea longa]POY36358.1 Hsp20/alpha crystallin family protein [Solitalea longa]
MTLIKRNYPAVGYERVNPFVPVFNGFFDDLFKGGSLGEFGLKSPAVNVMENETGFTIELAAPGLKKEDFTIDLDKDTLTVSVQKESEQKKEEGKNYHRREFSFSSFKRSFNLPETVDRENIGAEYNDGVLSLSIPKKAEAQLKAKQIKVS